MSETLMETREQVQRQQLAKSSFPAMLEKFKGEIARALPRHLNPDRMCRIALTEFRKNPKLAECDPRSVFAAIIVASQLGLEPGVLGQAFLIPYKNECQLIPGYQGLIELVRRAGTVQRIEAHVVRQGEKFVYKTGLHTVLEHEPILEGTPGALRLVYAVAEFRDGGHHVEVMTEQQINVIRDRSQGYINAKKYGKTTPWDTDTEEMWRKTALRRICKFLPKSPEIATALSLEDAAMQGRQAITVQDAIDGTWQAPVIEGTQDEALASKSARNLEEIKERYQAASAKEAIATAEAAENAEKLEGVPSVADSDPERARKMREEAERQKQAVAEKFGAISQPSQSAPVGAADAAEAEQTSTNAPPQPVQEDAEQSRSTDSEPPAEAEDSVVAQEPSASPETSEETHIPTLDFGNAPRGKTRKR